MLWPTRLRTSSWPRRISRRHCGRFLHRNRWHLSRPLPLGAWIIASHYERTVVTVQGTIVCDHLQQAYEEDSGDCRIREKGERVERPEPNVVVLGERRWV